MLEETARDTDAEVKDQSKVARIIAVVLAVVIPASAVFGYLALGRYNAMDPPSSRPSRTSSARRRATASPT